MIIQFPNAAERERILVVRKIADALRKHLADGPKSASGCSKLAKRFGGGRAEYEAARKLIDAWCVQANNIDLALPIHGRKYAGFDEHGQPIAWAINAGRPMSLPKWNSRKA